MHRFLMRSRQSDAEERKALAEKAKRDVREAYDHRMRVALKPLTDILDTLRDAPLLKIKADPYCNCPIVTSGLGTRTPVTQLSLIYNEHIALGRRPTVTLAVDVRPRRRVAAEHAATLIPELLSALADMKYAKVTS